MARTFKITYIDKDGKVIETSRHESLYLRHVLRMVGNRLFDDRLVKDAVQLIISLEKDV